jgi:hypothetical protein
MVMKWVVLGSFLILYILVTFFGMGPVLLADGSLQERVLTLAIVLLLYVGITLVLKIVLKKLK